MCRFCLPCLLHYVTLCKCRLVRHPGYMGWFIWSLATQLLLVNPICGLAYAYMVSSS